MGKLPRPGDTFDGYTVVSLIGQGNMGRIYRARDRMGRDVAIKVILTEVASEEGLARFEREGQAMASIPRHKYVIGVHSAGRYEGRPFLVLDYVKGSALEDVLKDGPLPVVQAVLVAEKLSRALDHVHQSGVLHRDLKPANVLIRHVDGEPILTDFGLAGLRGADTLTKTGDVIGTPLYMAPEQVLGLHKEVDGRADVWSVGVLLYEMITGTVPFPGTTMLDVLDGITGKEPQPVHELNDNADPSLSALLARAMAKDKRERIPSPGALAAALRAWRKAFEGGQAPPPLPPSPLAKRRRILLGLALVLAIFAGVVLTVAISRWRASQQQAGDPKATPSVGPSASGDREAALALVERASAALGTQSVDFKSLEACIADPELAASGPQLEKKLRGLQDLILLKANSELSTTAPSLPKIARLITAAGKVQALVPGARWRQTFPSRLIKYLPSRGEILSDTDVLETIQALVKADLRPEPNVLLNLVDHFTTTGVVEKSDHYKEYYRLLVACTKLGLPFVSEHHLSLPGQHVPNHRPQASASEAYLWLRIKLSQRRLPDVREQIMELVRADTLPAANLLDACWEAREELLERESIDASLTRVSRALVDEPHVPYGWLTKCWLLHRKALAEAEAGREQAMRTALEDAWRAASRAVDLMEQPGAESWQALRQRSLSLALTARLAHMPTAPVAKLRAGIQSSAQAVDATDRAKGLRNRLDELLRQSKK